LVKDKPRNSIAGEDKKTNSMKLMFRCSRGKNKVNRRKEAGMIPDVVKLILPHRSIGG
jgi:hypothetical protein